MLVVFTYCNSGSLNDTYCYNILITIFLYDYSCIRALFRWHEPAQIEQNIAHQELTGGKRDTNCQLRHGIIQKSTPCRCMLILSTILLNSVGRAELIVLVSSHSRTWCLWVSWLKSKLGPTLPFLENMNCRMTVCWLIVFSGNWRYSRKWIGLSHVNIHVIGCIASRKEGFHNPWIHLPKESSSSDKRNIIISFTSLSYNYSFYNHY